MASGPNSCRAGERNSVLTLRHPFSSERVILLVCRYRKKTNEDKKGYLFVALFLNFSFLYFIMSHVFSTLRALLADTRVLSASGAPALVIRSRSDSTSIALSKLHLLTCVASTIYRSLSRSRQPSVGDYVALGSCVCVGCSPLRGSGLMCLYRLFFLVHDTLRNPHHKYTYACSRTCVAHGRVAQSLKMQCRRRAGWWYCRGWVGGEYHGCTGQRVET